MKIEGGALHYSSLPNEAPRAGKAPPSPARWPPSASPRKALEGSARRFAERARALVPTRLFAVPCLSVPQVLDEVTPVLYYVDEDAGRKRDCDDAVTFLDPFAFEDSKKEAYGDGNSPTSVVSVGLLSKEARNSRVAADTANGATRNEEQDVFEELVSFDCPFFTEYCTFGEEDTSIDVSEAIKSINDTGSRGVTSVREALRARRGKEALTLDVVPAEASAAQSAGASASQSSDAWQESLLLWKGFKKSANFTLCKWDPSSSSNRSTGKEHVDARIPPGAPRLSRASVLSTDGAHGAPELSTASVRSASVSVTTRTTTDTGDPAAAIAGGGLVADEGAPACGSADLRFAIAGHASAIARETAAIRVIHAGIGDIQAKLEAADARSMEECDDGYAARVVTERDRVEEALSAPSLDREEVTHAETVSGISATVDRGANE